MWTPTAANNLKNAFDDAIEIAYGNGRKGELENLANLFGPVALRNYQKALRKGLDVDSKAFVDVAWIDKRPIAKHTAKDPGAELGDMMIVVEEYDPDGLRYTRACLLEVKQSPSDEIPPVPVTDGNSTRNQFKILSSWPTLYGLKATGSNGEYLLEKITTQPGSAVGGVLAQAWYVAVKPPLATSPTPMPWMAAPAVQDALFEHTLGDVFGACARGDSLTNSRVGIPIDVGRAFDSGLTLQNPPGWDALINTIISVTYAYDLPPKYFPHYKVRRYLMGRSYYPAAAIGGLNIPSGVTPTVSGVLIGILISVVTVMLFRVFKMGMFMRRSKKRFPILFFTVIHNERIERARNSG